MLNEFSRTELLLGEAGVARLSRAAVIVFGVGGVGSYAAEALARGGVGRLVLVDSDIVSLTNINRQLVALHSTLGLKKAEVMADRAKDINPNISVEARVEFYTAENADAFELADFDYVVDAIDTVSSKLLLAERTAAAQTPIIACMGAGNKLDPTRLEVADIFETSMCPLARVMRAELRKRAVPALRVVYSKEPAMTPLPCLEETTKRQPPGSVPFVPSVAGLLLAAEVIKALSKA